jgi:hypothetical protein
MIIYTIEAESRNLSSSAVTWYFSTSEFTTKPSDTPANISFVNRILNPGSIGISLYSNGKTSGGSKLEIGDVVLLNNDGALDELTRYSFDGRDFIIRRGDSKAAYPSGFTTIFIGTAESIDVNYDSITFRLRDKSYLLERPLLTTNYGGTNSLPNGIDGTQDDIMGNVLPRLFGNCFNISLDDQCVNTSKLIYRITNNSINTVSNVYDMGVALTAGTNRANNAAMQATAPAAGAFDTCTSEGLIRLGSAPAGQVTCDAYIGASAANRTVAQLIKDIAFTMGVSAYAADITALDTLNNAVVGIWVNEDRTALSTLDELAESIGACYYFDRLNQFRMALVDVPYGAPSLSISIHDIINLRSIPANDQNVSVYKITLNYLVNEVTQQGSDLAGSVSVARRSYLKKKVRTIIYEDASMLAYSKLANKKIVNTRLTTYVDAANEISRLSSLYATIPPKRIVECTIHMSNFNYNLMDYINLQANDYRSSGYGAFSGWCILIGYTLNLSEETATLLLWNVV